VSYEEDRSDALAGASVPAAVVLGRWLAFSDSGWSVGRWALAVTTGGGSRAIVAPMPDYP
jgi:hypothetical protein